MTSALTQDHSDPGLMQTFRRLNGTRETGKTKISRYFYKESTYLLETIEETFALNNPKQITVSFFRCSRVCLLRVVRAAKRPKSPPIAATKRNSLPLLRGSLFCWWIADYSPLPLCQKGIVCLYSFHLVFQIYKSKKRTASVWIQFSFWDFEVCLSACITYLDKIMSFQNSYKQIVVTCLLFCHVKFPPCSNKSPYRNLPNFQNWTMLYYKQRQNKYSSKIPPVKKCNSIPYFTFDQEGVLCRGKIL